jgi:ABC-type branched-subunit amino acid transport system substrate-binding protein
VTVVDSQPLEALLDKHGGPLASVAVLRDGDVPTAPAARACTWAGGPRPRSMAGRRRRSVLVALVCAVALAGCGSTVQGHGSRTAALGAGTDEQQALGGAAGGPDGIGTAADGSTASGSAPGGGRAGAGGPGTPSARPGVSGAAAGAAAVRGPIKIGVLYVVNDGAESAGINNGNSFSLNQAVHAFVDAYNGAGGIGGRRIDPVYAEMHSASNDYEAQVQAVCTSFTQDHHVAAVISNVGYYSSILLACLQKASVPLVSGDWTGPDRQDAGRYPLFVTPTTMVGDARVAAVVEHLAGAGFLQARSRVGAVVEDCPVDQRIYDNALVPALRRAGLTLTATYRPRCFLSLQDYGGQASDIQGAVLQFRQAGVDRVIFVSQAAEANIMNLFSTGADAQGYRPGYALSSLAAPAVLALNAPAAQLANAKGVGWLPALDTQRPAQAPPTATGQRCLDMMKKQGIVATSASDYNSVYGPCDSFGLYDALLRATGGDASAAAILGAMRVVGTSYVNASTVGGRVSVSGDGRPFAGAGRLFGWVGDHFEYTTDAFPL